jgi:hypothetical protein
MEANVKIISTDNFKMQSRCTIRYTPGDVMDIACKLATKYDCGLMTETTNVTDEKNISVGTFTFKNGEHAKALEEFISHLKM